MYIRPGYTKSTNNYRRTIQAKLETKFSFNKMRAEEQSCQCLVKLRLLLLVFEKINNNNNNNNQGFKMLIMVKRT